MRSATKNPNLTRQIFPSPKRTAVDRDYFESIDVANYRREHWSGATYFLTQVTYQRQRWLCDDLARSPQCRSILKVRAKYPFQIDAFVLLPDHFHCLWTLPEKDGDYSTRMRLIKASVTRSIGDRLGLDVAVSASRQARREGNLWQRRFWEHRVRDEVEFAAYCDYIHFNPVNHGLCQLPTDWQWSSIHRFIARGLYPRNWEWHIENSRSIDVNE